MLEPTAVLRVVAEPRALDAASAPAAVRIFRTAPDEALFVSDDASFADPEDVSLSDPHAIVVRDTGWWGGWWSEPAASSFLAHHCEWELPSNRPTFSQGMVAHLPVKLWIEEERIFFLVAHVFAQELSERMGVVS